MWKTVNPVRELRPLTVCSVDHRLKSAAFSNGVKIAAISVLISILFLKRLFAVDLPSPRQEAGPQAERFKLQTEEVKEEIERKKTPSPKIEIEKEEKEKAPAVETLSFTLKELTIVGATVFKPEEFRSIYESRLNKKVTFADLEEIIEKIKNKYKEKGYFSTIVYLPEQDIKEGKLEIRIVETKMGSLLIEGNKRFKTSLMERYFHTAKNEILNLNKLQRDILRLNKNPDLEIKTVISAGEKDGTSDVILKVKEDFPYHIGFMEDNQGTRLAGKNRSSPYWYSTNLSGCNDSLFMNTIYAKETIGESISYKMPIDTYGTNVGLDLLYFRVKLGKEYKSSDILGISEICAPHISRELALSETFEAYGDMGLEIKSIKRTIGGGHLSDEQLRLPYMNLNFNETDYFCGGGQTTFSPNFVFGTDGFLGASSRGHPSAAREGTGGFF